MKTNKLLIQRSEILRKESLRPRSLFPNSRARAWLIFQTVGLFLLLTLCGYGQQTNAVIREKNSLMVTNKEAPPRVVAEIRTLDGRTYRSVRVLKVEPDGLLVEHSLQAGSIGMARLKFANLSADLQQRYGYDAQKAAAYRVEQAATQRQVVQVMQAQEAAMAQQWARIRARDEDNFKGRLEIEKQETQRRQAEAARAQAEAARAQAEAARAQAEAAQAQAAAQANAAMLYNDRQLNEIQDDVYHIRRMQKWGW